MLIEILISTFIGIFAGTITGLLPGIHINLVGTILVSLSATFFSLINPLYLISFIASMAITHTFIDFIYLALMRWQKYRFHRNVAMGSSINSMLSGTGMT